MNGRISHAICGASGCTAREYSEHAMICHWTKDDVRLKRFVVYGINTGTSRCRWMCRQWLRGDCAVRSNGLPSYLYIHAGD